MFATSQSLIDHPYCLPCMFAVALIAVGLILILGKRQLNKSEAAGDETAPQEPKRIRKRDPEYDY